jgi:hypothetical protein
MGKLTLDNIPGRWGRATAKGDEEAAFSMRDIYEVILTRRETLCDEQLAA